MSAATEPIQLVEEAAEIRRDTALSQKEAEAYVAVERTPATREEAADMVGISKGNLSGKMGRILGKIKEARRTAELELSAL